MVAVGEETGDLDKMLMKVADKYDEQVDVLVGSLMPLLEPIMIIGLGAIVGVIVMAVFLPMIQVITQPEFSRRLIDIPATSKIQVVVHL